MTGFRRGPAAPVQSTACLRVHPVASRLAARHPVAPDLGQPLPGVAALRGTEAQAASDSGGCKRCDVLEACRVS